MASGHLVSYVLFILAALIIVVSLTSLAALPGATGPILALALLLVGYLMYRRGR